jgi:Tol biopolymer transport system component
LPSNEAARFVIAVGGSAMNITNNWASDTSPAWSPDGTRIVLASDRDGQAESSDESMDPMSFG